MALARGQHIPVVKHFPGHGDTLEDPIPICRSCTRRISELAALKLIPLMHAIDPGRIWSWILAHIFGFQRP